jgi:hypothetical protein
MKPDNESPKQNMDSQQNVPPSPVSQTPDKRFVGGGILFVLVFGERTGHLLIAILICCSNEKKPAGTEPAVQEWPEDLK